MRVMIRGLPGCVQITAENESSGCTGQRHDRPQIDTREINKYQNYWELVIGIKHNGLRIKAITHAVPLRKQSTWGPTTVRPRVRWSRCSSRRVPIARPLRRRPKRGPAIRRRSRPTRRSFWRPRYRSLCNTIGTGVYFTNNRNRPIITGRVISRRFLYILGELVDADLVELR